MTNQEIIDQYCQFNDCAWIKELNESQMRDLRIIMTNARWDQMDKIKKMILNERQNATPPINPY